MDHTFESDEELMTRVSYGFRHEMEPLVRRYAVPLLTFIQRFGGGQESQDIFQEVFLAVWIHRATYRAGGPFRPWLYKIAVNKCRESFRRRHWSIAQLRDSEPLDFRAGSGPTPSDDAVAREAAAGVNRALEELPVKQRAVLVMRIWSGLSYADIAQTLGRSETTVRSQMFHALRKLRPLVRPYTEGTSERSPCHDAT